MDMVLCVLLAAVVILQIITISIVSGGKKHKRNNYEFKHPRAQGSDNRNERKDGDFRRRDNNSNNRKFQHENKNVRPQHSNAPAQHQQNSQVTIDPVEKSLRDINLRLKNAEREQESARKKINDYGAKDGRPQRSGNGGGNRKNNRDRNFNRADQRRDNWQEKQANADPVEQIQETAPAAPAFENEKPHIVQPAFETSVSVTESSVQVTTDDNAASAEGEFEHGRKFVAKRRHLQESDTAETETSAANENSAEAAVSEQLPEETEMKFGRR